jgi:hypothetical protein
MAESSSRHRWETDEGWQNRDLVDLDRRFGSPESAFDQSVYQFYSLLAEQGSAVKQLGASFSHMSVDMLLATIVERNNVLRDRFDELLYDIFRMTQSSDERTKYIAGLFVVTDAFLEPEVARATDMEDEGVALNYEGMLEYIQTEYTEKIPVNTKFVRVMNDRFQGYTESQINDLREYHGLSDDGTEETNDKTEESN